MRIVAARELQDWLAHGTVLEKDSRGPKVVHLDNGLILKIFHTRRHPWFARLNPPAQRFAQNANTLHELSIPAPKVVENVWLDRVKGLSACIYQPLPGASLESVLKESPERMQQLLPALAVFILTLHNSGIYFRSLHLGNILHISGNNFGLIDFLDLTKKPRKLNKWETKRNLEHLRNYLQRRKVNNFPIDALIHHYYFASQSQEAGFQ